MVNGMDNAEEQETSGKQESRNNNEEGSTQPSNQVSEIVDGVITTVDISKHPEASIPQSDLSLADIERSKSKPKQWAVFLIGLLAAIVVPYGIGRQLAGSHTGEVIHFFEAFMPQGIALVAWAVTVIAFTSLAMSLVDSHSWFWRGMFVVWLAAEQLIAGLCLLRFDYWYSTYVVYGDAAGRANAANLGIIAAGFGVAVYAVIFVGLLVVIRKDSPLNVLTRSWASFILFYVIEVIALLIVLFGGLLTVV